MPALSSSPIVAALDHVEVDLDEVTALPGAGLITLSLVEALSAVPDPRSARGVRHGVLGVLPIGACAVPAGARSWVAIAEYAHDVGEVVLGALGVGAVVPHESTIRRVLQQIDAVALGAALWSWTLSRLATRAPDPAVPGREQRPVWALDGKALRGARTHSADGTDPGRAAGAPGVRAGPGRRGRPGPGAGRCDTQQSMGSPLADVRSGRCSAPVPGPVCRAGRMGPS
ncbi:transposase family protein [Pseudonocardia sp.]|uniref:transposase family protein n=1 Tax=Pseudonocardia sp. TaxID=60912 RepID=UPI00343E5B46